MELYIKNKLTGEVHKYGTHSGDSLVPVDNGIAYYNLEDGWSSIAGGQYEFCLSDGSAPGDGRDDAGFIDIADSAVMQSQETKQYYVTFRLDARYVAEVTASSVEEAIAKAKTAYVNADFGEVDDVVTDEIVRVEDDLWVVWPE